MKKFTYTARDVRGMQTKGTIVAEDEREYLAKLHEKGLTDVSHKETDSDETKTTHKFSTKELAFCCRQLSAMLTSGLTLVKALDILCKEQEKDSCKVIWRDVYENVQKGESFSASLEMHEGAFPQFLTSMVAAGESSGSLDVIMQRMSDHYAKENKMNNIIKGAMVYPIILLVLTIAIVIGLFTFILPAFMDMYENESDMPILTRGLNAISKFLTTKWYILIAIVAGLVFGIIYALKVPSIRLKFDRFLIKGPVIGGLITTIYTGRFARTLSSLYSSGIPMVECLERSSAILNNRYVSEKFEQVISEVKQGETLSSAITRTEIFESMFCSIIFVGEEAGALDSILDKSAAYYEEESDAAVDRLVGLLSPVMIIILGLTIGLVLGGIYPAIYQSLGGLENL